MHKEAFTPDNTAMLLIDHQVGTMAWTHSSDINLVKRNALHLARIARAGGLTVVLTASMKDRIQGPLVPELEQIPPGALAQRIKRPGIVNAMHHDGFNRAVKATGRKKQIVAGVTTEICLTFLCCRCSRKVTKCKCRPTLPLPGRSWAISWLSGAWRMPAL